MGKNKEQVQKCDKCRKPTKETAAVEINGKIKWLCWKCYKQQKE